MHMLVSLAADITGQGIFTAIAESLQYLWSWIIDEANTLLSSSAFLYLFVFGVAVSVTMLVFKIIRKLMWGA